MTEDFGVPRIFPVEIKMPVPMPNWVAIVQRAVDESLGAGLFVVDEVSSDGRTIFATGHDVQRQITSIEVRVVVEDKQP